jgi:hypothetical protein
MSVNGLPFARLAMKQGDANTFEEFFGRIVGGEGKPDRLWRSSAGSGQCQNGKRRVQLSFFKEPTWVLQPIDFTAEWSFSLQMQGKCNTALSKSPISFKIEVMEKSDAMFPPVLQLRQNLPRT